MGNAVQYDREVITDALATLAYHGGNETRAYKALQERGCEFSKRALNQWKTSHADIWYEAQTRRDELFAGKMADDIERVVVKENQLEEIGVDLLLGTEDTPGLIYELPAKELAAVVQRISTAKAIGIDKSRLLRDKPTSVVQHLEPTQLHADLMELLKDLPAPPAVIDVPEADVIEVPPNTTGGDPSV